MCRLTTATKGAHCRPQIPTASPVMIPAISHIAAGPGRSYPWTMTTPGVTAEQNSIVLAWTWDPLLTDNEARFFLDFFNVASILDSVRVVVDRNDSVNLTHMADPPRLWSPRMYSTNASLSAHFRSTERDERTFKIGRRPSTSEGGHRRRHRALLM